MLARSACALCLMRCRAPPKFACSPTRPHALRRSIAAPSAWRRYRSRSSRRRLHGAIGGSAIGGGATFGHAVSSGRGGSAEARLAARPAAVRARARSSAGSAPLQAMVIGGAVICGAVSGSLCGSVASGDSPARSAVAWLVWICLLPRCAVSCHVCAVSRTDHDYDLLPATGQQDGHWTAAP